MVCKKIARKNMKERYQKCLFKKNKTKKKHRINGYDEKELEKLLETNYVTKSVHWHLPAKYQETSN